MENCIFCKIIKGEIPCYKVYEDTDNLAFLDIHPHAMGHTVIVPKKHFETVLEMDDPHYQSFNASYEENHA